MYIYNVLISSYEVLSAADFRPMRFKHCNTNGSCVWTTSGTSKNEPHLVAFHESM